MGIVMTLVTQRDNVIVMLLLVSLMVVVVFALLTTPVTGEGCSFGHSTIPDFLGDRPVGPEFLSVSRNGGISTGGFPADFSAFGGSPVAENVNPMDEIQ